MICQGEEGEELEYQSEDEDDESSTSEGGTSNGTTINVEEKVKLRISNLPPSCCHLCCVIIYRECKSSRHVGINSYYSDRQSIF